METIEKLTNALNEIVAAEIKSFGDYEINLVGNQYGFCSAWVEEDGSVWWDKHNGYANDDMSELTELSALLDVIKATKDDIESNSVK